MKSAADWLIHTLLHRMGAQLMQMRSNRQPISEYPRYIIDDDITTHDALLTYANEFESVADWSIPTSRHDQAQTQ